MKGWYRRTTMKAHPDRRRVNLSDVFHISYSNNLRLTGTLNPAETVKLIGEPYEESSGFLAIQ